MNVVALLYIGADTMTKAEAEEGPLTAPIAPTTPTPTAATTVTVTVTVTVTMIRN